MAATSSSKTVIYAALVGNLLVALTKFGAAWWTGSSAMLSEGLHSLVDTSNQLFISRSPECQSWGPNTQVQNQSSKAAPALAVFENKLWIAFVANDATNQLLVSHSAGGKNWSPSTQVQNQSSKATPALLALA